MHPADDNALNTEEKIWDLTMNINLKGVWWGCKVSFQVLVALGARTDADSRPFDSLNSTPLRLCARILAEARVASSTPPVSSPLWELLLLNSLVS